nr:hypothetical protein CFP56_67952 [Quercus suber]
MATFEPLVKSLSVENETLKNNVAILTAETENDKERVATLEKSLQVEKDFYKLKDKQIDDLELKLQNVGAIAWMAKHHPNLDLSGLAVDDIEKELMSDHPFEVTAKNKTKEAKNTAKVMKEALVPNEQ